MLREEILTSFHRKEWEYRPDRPNKLKEIAEAYILFNGKACPMRIGDYGAWWFEHKQLSSAKQHPYQAYKPIRFCTYKGYVYVFDLVGDIVILNPRSNRTRMHLHLNNTDRRQLVMRYDEFIASSPTVWEERSSIKGFLFDVEPKVFLFRNNSYIEENLFGAWHQPGGNPIN